MSNTKFLLGSNQHQNDRFSSTKKRLATPALLFCKSNNKDTQMMNQNNSSLMNTNKSPIRQLQNDKQPLINRNSSMNSINNNNDSRMNYLNSKSRLDEMSMKESVHFCENHETKTATYMSSIYENNVEYYCDKCAILLASQGYAVDKIAQSSSMSIGESRNLQISRNIMNTSSISQKSSKSSKSILTGSRAYNPVSSRRQQINNFLNMTKHLMGHIDIKKQQIHENLVQSQQFYGNQIQQVNQYFQLVFKSLQLQKNKCYNYILNQRLQVEQPVRMINQMIGELKQKIQTIIQDIEDNIETVYETADDIYRPVIEQYQENYEDILRKIQQIQIVPVEMRKIDFEGVPQSIFYLSDILKDSIQNTTQFVQNQKKMHDQLDSLRQSLKQSFPQIEPRMLFTKKSNNDEKKLFCFSFQGEALREQLSQEKIIYQMQQ